MSFGAGHSQDSGSHVLIVPQSRPVLDQFKYEIAQELGITLPEDGYMGQLASRDTGAIGGHMTRKLIEIAQQLTRNS